MTKSKNPDRIAELLAAYGSDVSRWPEADRSAIAALSPKERAARLREDVAIDKLIAGAAQSMDQAPAPDALMARILNAATIEADEADGQRKIIEFEPVTPDSKLNEPPATYQRRDWRAVAALLAASLVLGIFVGSTEQGQSTALGIGNIAGLNMTLSPVRITTLDDVLQPQDDEDIL